ncbi:MAG: HipA N-terminal domain-containing protein [Parachlamydiaceae bacterium]
MPFKFDELDGIQVMLEKNTGNQAVGILTRNERGFHFEYDKEYLHAPKAISLGPEMPLTRRSYEAKHLFRPFAERIPSRENPAYSEYCLSAGISANEQDPLILLSTIAARGPSSFLFKPIYKSVFTGSDLKKYRNFLGLSTREFALAFDFSQPGITRAETGTTDGRDILKRAEIYALYPIVAIDQLRRRSAFLHREKLERALKRLKEV